MEFDEMKKIWDAQKDEYVFTINQSAMHNHVIRKQKQSLHITNISEWVMIVVNILVPVYIVTTTVSSGSKNISLIILSGWLFLTAAYIINGRVKRISGSSRFDRSLNGDLEFAVEVARYQVRLAALGRWNIVPIGVLTVTGLVEAEKPLWIAGAVVAVFIIANYVAGWESNIYKSRLVELEGLRNKLEAES